LKTSVLSRHPRFGEIDSIGGRCWGLRAVPPVGSRGRTPGQGVWGEALQKLEAFCCLSSLFLSILEDIVEL